MSRNDAGKAGFLDVAGAGIIDHRSAAHNYGRLYFRPRTPTQYSIEGIRKLSDIAYSAHAPMRYMLVFDASKILTLEDTECSNGNMQSWGTAHDATEDFFLGLPFSEIYHEGGLAAGWTREINHRRCAEVLVQSPFNVKPALKFIYCRSSAERDTLLHELGVTAKYWLGKIVISDDLNVFEKRYSYVQSVDIDKTGVSFKLHPRYGNQTVELRIRARLDQTMTFDDTYSRQAATAPNGNSSWIRKANLTDGSYLVRIDIEGHMAYRNVLDLGDVLF